MSDAAAVGAALPQQEPEAEPADLRALRLLLRQSKDFRLAIALYNDPVWRDRWIRSLVVEHEKEGLRILTLDLLHEPDDGRGLLDQVRALAEKIPAGQRFSIMVVNIESRVHFAPELPLSGSSGTTFLQTANLQRELFPRECRGPVVLWMTELMERAFISSAPDLWSWRNHIFDLRTRILPMASLADGEGNSFTSDDPRLHPEIRLRRLEEELAAYRRTGSRRDEMRILNFIGIARLAVGETKVAQLDFEAALKIARELGDQYGEANALGNLGVAHRNFGDAAKAIQYQEQRLTISGAIGDRQGEANALGNLGLAYSDSGDARKAIEYHERHLMLVREIGNRSGECAALCNLGNAHYSLADVRKAIEYFEKALVIAREIGDRSVESNALGSLGNAYYVLGDALKAVVYHEQQLRIARMIGDRRGEANSLYNSALVLNSLSQRAEAVARAKEALTIYEVIESPFRNKVRVQLAKWHGTDRPA